MEKAKSPLFLKTVALVKAIPKGRVLTYGEVARLISSPGSARYVSYILSSSSKKYKLPWQRVISSSGKVASHASAIRQVQMLKREKITVEQGRIDLKIYSWKPTKKEVKAILKA